MHNLLTINCNDPFKLLVPAGFMPKPYDKNWLGGKCGSFVSPLP